MINIVYFKIIFKKEDEIILKLGENFAHKYKKSEINLAVLDLLEYMKSGGTDYWENNQLEYILFNPSIDEIVSGKYKIYFEYDIPYMLDEGQKELKKGWNNEKQFFSLLKRYL